MLTHIVQPLGTSVTTVELVGVLYSAQVGKIDYIKTTNYVLNNPV